MRLIDADSLKSYMWNAYEQVKHRYPDGGEWAKEITGDFCKDIDEQPTINQWIPCSERLPDGNGQFLISTRNGIVYVAKYSFGKWQGFFNKSCVAWMPLPEPYKED